MSLELSVCVACSEAVFPPRLLCPGCGGSVFRRVEVERGTLLRSTQTRGVRIGEVGSELGPLVIARLEEALEDGAEVSLGEVDGAPCARRAR